MTVPVLRVHLDDPVTGSLSYRGWTKAARWRSGFRNIDAACNEVDAITGITRYDIDYVMERN